MIHVLAEAVRNIKSVVAVIEKDCINTYHFHKDERLSYCNG